MRLIFRPIGDTIGLVLRPFALMMIKWAVPFYQKFSETIPEIMEGADDISEGRFSEGNEKIGGSLIDTIFGEGAGETFRKNEEGKRQMWENLFKGITEAGDGFFKWLTGNTNSWFTMQTAFADTGEEVSTTMAETNKEMDSFIEWMKSVADEIKKRTTLEGLGIEPGSDFTSSGQGGAHSNSRNNFGTSKLLSRSVYEKLIGRNNVESVNAWMERRGYTGIASGQTGERTSGGRQTFAGNGLSVTITTPLDDPQLGAKIQNEVQKQLKKLPGRGRIG